ncbi:hypothetical protein BVRB_019890, partial [Beta vulgaris subsp. vulgaris]
MTAMITMKDSVTVSNQNPVRSSVRYIQCCGPFLAESLDTDQSNVNDVTSTEDGLFSPAGSRRTTAIFSEENGLNMPHLHLNKNWAGPGIGTSHWRFKGESQQNVCNQESDMEVLRSKLKRARISHEIDFRGPHIPESDLADPPRASNLLSKASYKKSSTLNHLLPTDLHISHSVLFRLFHRPNFLRPVNKTISANGNMDSNFGFGGHGDDGPTNFVIFNQEFDDEDDDGLVPNICQDNDDVGFCIFVVCLAKQCTQDGGLFTSEFNFVAQPTTAEKIELDFA